MIESVEDKLRKGFTVLYVAILVAYCLFYITRHDHFLSWDLTSSAQKDDFVAATFQKGLFNFELTGTRYTLEENFEGSEVLQSPLASWTFLISWLGIAYLLTCLTYLKRFWFTVTNGIFILFLVSLDLGSLELFGLAANSKVLLAVIIVLLVAPGYFFHAFRQTSNFLIRLTTFVTIISVLALIIENQASFAFDFLKAQTVYGFSALTFVFVAFVAEEIIFLILYVVTQARGKGNERHFILVGVIFLGFVVLYFLKKAGIYANTLAFLNPYFLLPVSAMVALWTLKFKQETFEDNLSNSLDIRHFLVGFGLVGFGTLSTFFIGGNDPGYESFHYLITYAHLGFGGMFFIYVIMNFIDALIAGHPVYRIVYRERNFPYATSRLVGFIAVLAFFFMSEKEAMRLAQGARYNYLGDYERLTENAALADRYYEQGGVFAYNNHYSNYQLGLTGLRNGNTEEAAYRFDRASQRYPTPQAYVNASVYIKDKNLPKAISLLRTSELDFGKKGEIDNNLANLLITNARMDEASSLLTNASGTGDWNMATRVNHWRLLTTSGQFSGDIFQNYTVANSPVKANMISYVLAKGLERNLPFDTTDLALRRDLHHLILLNNAAYLGAGKIPPHYFQNAISATYNGVLQEDLKFADLFNRYLSGDVNGAYLFARELEFSISVFRKAQLQNLIGMLLLEQGVLIKALDYFEKAEAGGFTSGGFHAAITLTEMEDWTKAEEKWKQLVAEDESLIPYYTQMQGVLEGEDEITFNHLYYRWREFTAEELVKQLSDLQIRQEFVNNLWRKIESILFQEQQVSGYQNYLRAFTPLLQPESLQRGEIALMFLNREKPIGLEDPTNAFDEIATINYVNHLAQTDTLAAYQTVIDAVNVHEQSLLYQVRYVELALDLGILSYAEEGLAKLEGRLSRNRLDQLKSSYEERRKELMGGFAEDLSQ